MYSMNRIIPFDGDIYLPIEIMKLKERWNIKTIVETGTYQGASTLWFAENFEKVITIEVNNGHLEKAKQYCSSCDNIEYILGSSIEVIPLKKSLLSTERCLFFLDAHWGVPCPTPLELKLLNNMEIKPIILIHDFFVPGLGRPDGRNNDPTHPGFGWGCNC